MSQNKPTARQIAIFCYFTLSQAARDWSWVFKSALSGQAKHRLTILHNAEKALNDCFKKELGADVIAAYAEDAAMWTDIMDILTSGTAEDKARFLAFLKAYRNGEVKEVYPDKETQTTKAA